MVDNIRNPRLGDCHGIAGGEGLRGKTKSVSHFEVHDTCIVNLKMTHTFGFSSQAFTTRDAMAITEPRVPDVIDHVGAFWRKMAEAEDAAGFASGLRRWNH